ncbi:hypothetical protein TRFO_25681 [Tritrichomonas foetus]|uniref:UDENN domain-containing protein n=1 Tax=Tritrichomonas foetus TaxID=1144522 RepID=A0A1J4K5K5_9EUKA|nr:hypothetical protein TRFO_25681 [Tritrichomonas foetus]|eukprot:OHT06274.1 hypothetical protein TRFO_25681 [Tritrichomonas foetus]
MIIQSIGNVSFTENDLVSLKSCAFPDTVVQSLTESTIFVFKIGKYYCYSIFTTTPDASASRGHRQFSYVIATSLPYVYPFTRILHSSMSLFDMPPNDVLVLISDFVQKSISLFPRCVGDDKEIPTFDGGLAVGLPSSTAELLDFVGSMGWTPQCKKYLINSNFLGSDLIFAFSVNQLISSGRSGDLLRIWESAMIDESIMVYGSNPTITSTAVLAIASLLYPEPIPLNLYPFVSVTDPRFQILTKSCPKGTIAGFSNPIALQRTSQFDLVLTTGFTDQENGLNIPKLANWPMAMNSKPHNNSNLRHIFYLNTVKVTEAIITCLQKLRETNPYAEFVAQIDSNVLASQIVQQGVQLNMSPRCFANKLIRSTFFTHIWRKRCTFEALLTELKHFSVDSLCTGKIEHELIDIYSTVKNVRRKCAGHKNLEEIIDADLTTITLYLSPDIILAPAME